MKIVHIYICVFFVVLLVEGEGTRIVLESQLKSWKRREVNHFWIL